MKGRALVLALPLVAACSNWTDQVSGPSMNPTAVQMAVDPQDLRDRYIVVFNDNVTNPSAVTDQLAAQFGATVHFRYAYAIKGFAATIPAATINGLRNNPNVSFIEPDGIVTVSDSGTDNSVSSWGLDRIDQHDLSLSNSYKWSHDGSGVHAYIIDTGIRPTHNEFGSPSRASVGYDAIGDGQNGIDCNGHGTHVAGTIGGAEYGVARNVTLVAVRVLNCSGSGTWAQVVAGIDWVKNNAIKPAVANMSLGGGFNTATNTAVANAVAAGVTFAVAAGNSNADACASSPSSTPQALTVGATSSNDARASFSNFGTCLDLFAPGVSITSSWIGADNATNTISGTSMASPHVAGVAALYLSSKTNATPADVEKAIKDSASQNKVTSPGTGSPNLLLYSRIGVASSSPPANNPPAASFTNSCTNLACNFNGSGSTDTDGTVNSYAWNFGDGSTGSGQTTNHNYAAAGTYTVGLTVTDDDGATGFTSKQVTVTAPPSGGINLSAAGYKLKGLQKVDLTWSGATTAVDIYRDNILIVTGTPNDGAHTDNIDARGSGTYTYRVCLTGTSTCSNNAVVIF
jgi:subtilisin family serine protease